MRNSLERNGLPVLSLWFILSCLPLVVLFSPRTPIALLSTSVTSIKRLKEDYSQYLKPRTWHAPWYYGEVKHTSTIFPGRVLHGLTLIYCVACVCECVFVWESMIMRDRKREGERGRQGWMESLTGPPTQPRLMETIITHSHSVCTIRASLSEGGTLSHTRAHTNTHAEYICAIFFSLPCLFSFLMYKLFLSLCRRG